MLGVFVRARAIYARPLTFCYFLVGLFYHLQQVVTTVFLFRPQPPNPYSDFALFCASHPGFSVVCWRNFCLPAARQSSSMRKGFSFRFAQDHGLLVVSSSYIECVSSGTRFPLSVFCRPPLSSVPVAMLVRRRINHPRLFLNFFFGVVS